jgi:ribosomal protein S18 acetylase RimI-like enzyme
VELEFRETNMQQAWRSTHDDSPMPPEVHSMGGWECIDASRKVGHCLGNSATGEIVLLSVDHAYRRQGIGRKLLSLVVGKLTNDGAQRIWLAGPRESSSPAYLFYRALGWRATGERQPCGDEILECPAQPGARFRSGHPPQ